MPFATLRRHAPVGHPASHTIAQDGLELGDHCEPDDTRRSGQGDADLVPQDSVAELDKPCAFLNPLMMSTHPSGYVRARSNLSSFLRSLALFLSTLIR
jgi:hypothetical protein